MLGSRFIGELFVDGKRYTDPDGWLTGVSDNRMANVVKLLDSYVNEKLLRLWMAEHKVEFHITDRKLNQTHII